jgi:ABC-type multidrug transport system fused ATPase/permease subunit
MTIGDFVSVNQAVSTLSFTLVEFTNLLPQMTNHSLFIDNYLKIMNYKSAMPEESDAVNIDPKKTHDLKIMGASFAYLNHNKPVLENINFEIKAGEHVALVGENGAGKTTLIKLITRLYEPVQGTLSMDNIPYKNIDKNSLFKAFSLVQQDFQTYSFSIKENIILSDVSETDNDKAIEKVLDTVGLLEKVNEFENGYNSG